MADEEIQELGREGVGMVKAWLESTTWIELPMNAYQDAQRCQLEYLPSKLKKFDLRGNFLGPNRSNIWVECKRYSTAGRQAAEFADFLGIAYGHTQRNLATYKSSDDQYMWVTSHPFSITEWSTLATAASIKNAFDKNADLNTNYEWHEDVAKALAERVWILVWAERQVKQLTLSSEELQRTIATLNRKANPLWNP